jgi:ABC-type antimicrobial peptide transport system permease subunit
MPSSYVKPYVKRAKTAAIGAEAICEAVTRPTTRFMPVKSEERSAAPPVTSAKGLSPGGVLDRPALPQTSPGLTALIGVRVGGLLTSATLVETVFGLPGAGRLLTAASLARDHALALGVFLRAVVLTLIANALTDAVCGRIDPRLGGDGASIRLMTITGRRHGERFV